MPKIPPEAAAEGALVLKTLFASVDTLAAALGNNTEIVVYDPTNPSSSVLKITNGHVSGRVVEDSMFSGPDGDLGFAGLLNARNPAFPSSEPLVIADYTTVTAKGQN
ncbi:PAS domain-containing protein [Rahnella selenatireducens]|uniref:PAS domain-containing protein n=1 Tax=Rahnella selenatireducens TaxID=3389797 RepID=UPI003969AAB5